MIAIGISINFERLPNVIFWIYKTTRTRGSGVCNVQARKELHTILKTIYSKFTDREGGIY